jgi:multidrug efflux system membrane fusion protein
MATNALRVEVRLPDESATDQPLSGPLTFLDNAVQDATGTVKLRATLANADRHFWPNRFVKIRLVLNTVSGAVLVPGGAPQMSANGQFVYVIKNDSTAELRLVKLGQRQGDQVVIASGLSAGERVVVNGQLGVTPGGKVRIAQPAQTPAPESAEARKTTSLLGERPRPSDQMIASPASRLNNLRASNRA